MVEMDLIDRARRVEWDEWYLSHTKMLLSFKGFNATQRFECIHDTNAPFVAIHEVENLEFFDSHDYKNRAGPTGTGEWQTKMNNWNRNFFEGLQNTPDINLGGALVIVEEHADPECGSQLDIIWLRSTGLDCSVDNRGLAVASNMEVVRSLAGTVGLRILKPLITRLTKADI